MHMMFETSRGKNVAPLKYPWMTYMSNTYYSKLKNSMEQCGMFYLMMPHSKIILWFPWYHGLNCALAQIKKESQLFYEKNYTITCMDINNLTPSLNHLTYKFIYKGRLFVL